MSRRCGRAARLSLASVAGQASAADRLELEAHLAGCDRCGAEHAALLAARATLAGEPAALAASARERVRQAALAAAPAAGARATRPARRWAWPFAAGGAGVAAAAAAVLAIWIARGPEAVPGVAAVSGDVAVMATAPGEGAGEAASGVTAGGAPVVTLRSRAGGHARLDDAAAELARATEIGWRRERRSVELRAGTVTIDVEHRPGQRFEVRTPRFLVEVVGTRFSVDMAGVRTERGKVRVLATDGTFIAYVAAGQSWRAPTDGPLTSDQPSPLPPAAPALPPPTISARGASPPSPAVSPDGGPGARLARARRALARGDAAEARRAVEPVFHAGREVAAEARVLHAESFLIEGRHADAVDGYEVVVRDFPGTPQAESALFAVAQLESEHGRPASARATLARYLARYPHGRFAREAADRLTRLAAPAR